MFQVWKHLDNDDSPAWADPEFWVRLFAWLVRGQYSCTVKDVECEGGWLSVREWGHMCYV